MKFIVGDLVEVIPEKNITMLKAGDRFIVKCVMNETGITSIDGHQYIGFVNMELPDDLYSDAVRNGKDPNWGNNIFKLIRRKKLAAAYYGI